MMLSVGTERAGRGRRIAASHSIDRVERRALERLAGSLAIVAGAAHGGLTPAHMAEWWGYGAFFLAATVAQVILGLALLLDAFEEDRLRRSMYVAGLVGSALIVLMYVVSRTIGVPFAGPERGEIEALDALGVVTTLAEVGTIVLLGLLLRRRA